MKHQLDLIGWSKFKAKKHYLCSTQYCLCIVTM